MSNRHRRLKARTLYVRPNQPPSLATSYRDACVTTGECPGCDVDSYIERDEHGIWHLHYLHDDGCPALEKGHQ